ncbi:MAG: hypothetical protein JSU72_15825 [Deltaproteobacteria bacterium]|nr:MAG: hypothetical protein JSU72_15825 [Deltaproteobacteria bacterium]
MGTSFLQLDDGVGPVLELKWQALRGKYSRNSILIKLARQSATVDDLNFRQEPVPDDWREALCGFDVQGFVWHGPEVKGEGAILYCLACQTATLLQFYQRKDQTDPHVAKQVLRSFRDHSEDGLVTWALFDLRALLPQRYQLTHHLFHPGLYQLSFQYRNQRVILRRWGPANLLLKTVDLKGWFEEKSKEFDWNNLTHLRTYDHWAVPTVQAVRKGSSSPGARFWARMSRKSPHIWIRIWHLRSQNQILGVEARGKVPLDEDLLEEICSNYEMVSSEESVGS